jgi:hypothetical protein
MHKRKSRRHLAESPRLFSDPQGDLPLFASTPEEIRQAVETNAIQRALLFVRVSIAQDLTGLIETVERLAAEYDREDFYEAAEMLGIDTGALAILDNASTPIPYPYYFCTPAYLVEAPSLVRYYRNVAMLSQKVMQGIGLGTTFYEERGVPLSDEVAIQLATYFNQIVSTLLKTIGWASPYGHLQMAFSNIGDSLGGASRNEVGRLASAQVVRMLALYLHQKGCLKEIVYRLKGRLIGEEDEDSQTDHGSEQVLTLTPQTDLDTELTRLEGYRVRYREIRLRNQASL